MSDLPEDFKEEAELPADFKEESAGDDLPADFQVEHTVEPGMLESVLRQAEQGATLSFGDELNAAIRAGKSKLVDGDKSSYGDLYHAKLAEERARLKEIEEAHPAVSFASNIAGGLATMPLLGALGLVGKGAALARGAFATEEAFQAARAAAEAAPLVTKIGHGIAEGAKVGAVMGVGNSEADLAGHPLDSLPKVAADAAEGAAIGAGTGGVITGGLEAGKGLAKGAAKVMEPYGDLPIVKQVKAAYGIGKDFVNNNLIGSKANEMRNDALKAGHEDVATALAEHEKELGKLHGATLDPKRGELTDSTEALQNALKAFEDESDNPAVKEQKEHIINELNERLYGKEQELVGTSEPNEAKARAQAEDYANDKLILLERRNPGVKYNVNMAEKVGKDGIKRFIPEFTADTQSEATEKLVTTPDKVVNTPYEVKKPAKHFNPAPEVPVKVIKMDPAGAGKGEAKVNDWLLDQTAKTPKGETPKNYRVEFDKDTNRIKIYDATPVDLEANANAHLEELADNNPNKRYSVSPNGKSGFTVHEHQMKMEKDVIPGTTSLHVDPAGNFDSELKVPKMFKAEPEQVKIPYRGNDSRITSVQDLIDYRNQIQKNADAIKRKPELANMYRKYMQLYHELNDAIETHFNKDVTEINPATGQPETKTINTFRDINKRYTAAMRAKSITPDINAARDISNPSIKGMDIRSKTNEFVEHLRTAYPDMAAAMDSGNADAHPLAKKVADLNKLSEAAALTKEINAPSGFKEVGTARGILLSKANSLGKIVGATTRGWEANKQAVIDATPERIQQMAAALKQTGGDIGEKLSNVFNDLATKDKKGRAATIFAISQNPNYRQLLHSSFGGDDETQKKP